MKKRMKKKKMRTYLARFYIQDGDHRHVSQFLVEAGSHEQAAALAQSQEHNAVLPASPYDALTWWDYGDGLTAAWVKEVIELSDEEAGIIGRLGIANRFN